MAWLCKCKPVPVGRARLQLPLCHLLPRDQEVDRLSGGQTGRERGHD